MNTYRGRFAPSPTGPLHFGSLIAAVSSYLDARHNQGEWLLRMEDLDPPREIPGAADDILHTLEALGMHWDGPVVYQSQRAHYYDDALAALERSGHIYGCACTRKEIADSSMKSGAGNVYPGTCRSGIPQGRSARSIRVQVYDSEITIRDRLHGKLLQRLGKDIGDFTVRRADQLIAYQLAVVVDDADHDISHVVRGADLFDSTPRQVYLQKLLGYPLPAYLHIPVAVNEENEKLSKQTHAQAVEPGNWPTLLCDVLAFLNQQLPESVEDASQAELWQWAIEHWNTGSLPATRSITAAPPYASLHKL
ncbi:MAG: tRNA glutamyl-Q(34) synthetase GluQRS [Gammaproteobacteria bacterium]|nr:tRNA glutamyl-Q(34) synthetase GluQRS [Gammaproteobacteria bacterium]